MKHVSLAVLPGDGIGNEVVPEALRVLDAIASLHGGLRFEKRDFPWGCEYYLKHGQMMPENALETLSGFDQIFLGAVGFPGVPDHVSLWGMLIPIRRGFQQYINLRPVYSLPGIVSPVSSVNENPIDFVVVRENSEGEYSDIGGRIHHGSEHESAIQVNYFSRFATERVIRYAFDLANQSKKKLTAATKSNGIIYTLPFWDEVCKQVHQDFPDVATQIIHIDALAAYFIMRPQEFDVVVASNLFGDILTDIGGAVMGSIGVAPAANLNPERKFPSMFEPVHGSAPDIAGRGIANPIGQIWTAKMMLDFLGEEELGGRLLEAIKHATSSGILTPDLGGQATTTEVTDTIIEHLLRG